MSTTALMPDKVIYELDPAEARQLRDAIESSTIYTNFIKNGLAPADALEAAVRSIVLLSACEFRNQRPPKTCTFPSCAKCPHHKPSVSLLALVQKLMKA